MKFQVLLLLLICINSLAQETPSDSISKPEMVDFKGYKIEIPLGWKVKDGCLEDQCTLLSPADTLTFFDKYTESINLTINKLSSTSYTVDQYAVFSIKYLPKVVDNFTVLEKKKLKSNAYRVTYRGKKNGQEQTWRQYYYVKNAKVYIVTFSAETTKYDYYQPLIEPYLNSFKLK